MLLYLDRAIDALLGQHVTAPHVAPGACASVTCRVKGEWWTLLGSAGRSSPADPASVSSESWFDLASVSKSFVAFCFARLVDRGMLSADAKLGRLVPECASSASSDTPLEWLLTHRAGLAAHVELFAPLRAGSAFDRSAALRRAADAVRPDLGSAGPDGFDALYSDLGYILLGEVIERVTRTPLDLVIARELADLGVPDVGSARVLGLRPSRVLPTEDVAWRGGLVRALVHDENAFALSGQGASGHAGLFGTVVGVTRFARALLELASGRSGALRPEALELLLRVRSGASLRGGFDGKSPQGSSVGRVMSDATFGHLGFTGTSFWCDPERDLAVVLLTNRVCPSRDNTALRALRPLLHDSLAELGLALRRDLLARP